MIDVDAFPSDTSWLFEPTTGVHQFGGGSLAQTIVSNSSYCARGFPNASCKIYRNDSWQNGMAMQPVDNNAYRYHGGPKYND
jgi:hypothetical protein